MKLESLKETKFKDSTLKKEQMFKLNGGVGTVTPGGSGCGYGTFTSDYYTSYSYDYGYDAIRTNADGTTYTTYHNRTNVVRNADCP